MRSHRYTPPAQPLSLQMKCLLISPFLAEAECDLVKVLAARGVVDVRRQFVSYGRGTRYRELVKAGCMTFFTTYSPI